MVAFTKHYDSEILARVILPESPTMSQAAARRATFGQYLRTFFGGSRSRMLTALLRQDEWTEKELEELESEIERIRKERKQP